MKNSKVESTNCLILFIFMGKSSLSFIIICFDLDVLHT